jgi:hypothetical protein
LDTGMTVHDVARALPDLKTLRRRCRALALLDAIVSPSWDDRRFAFEPGRRAGESIAFMRSGQDDGYTIVFSPAGAFAWGVHHDSPVILSLDGVPPAFAGYVNDPAFAGGGLQQASVCLWRETGDDRWRTGTIDLPAGEDPGGAGRLFEILLDPTPAAYTRFAESYHQKSLDSTAVAEVFASSPLSESLVQRLNPQASLTDLSDNLAKIGAVR